MRFLLAILIACGIGPAYGSTNGWVGCELDSLTYGTGSTSPGSITGSNYVSQMYLTRDFGCYVTNLAHAGDRVDTNTSAFDMLRNLTNATAYDKRTAVFLGGINDLAGNDSVATVTTNINAWCDNVKAAFPDCKIMGITIFDADVSATILGRISEVNAWMRTNVTRIDYVADAAADPRLSNSDDTTYFDPDKVHLNDVGYAVLAGIARSNLVYHRRVFAEYHVRADGNDSNRGATNSAAGAWLTISKAGAVATAGDIVTVTGTYNEAVTVANNGTATYPIRFQASGAVEVGTWTVNKGHHIIDGFKFTAANVSDGPSAFYVLRGNTTATNMLVTNCVFDVDVANSTPIYSEGASNWITGCSIVNTWKNGFQIGGKGSTVTNCTFSQTNSADAIHVLADNTTIVDCLFTNWSGTTPKSSGTLKVGMTYYFVSTNGTPSDFSNVGHHAWPYGIGDGVDAFTATGTTPTAWGGTVLDLSNHPDMIQAAVSYAPGVTVTNAIVRRCRFYNCKDAQLGQATDDGNGALIFGWLFENNVIANFHGTINIYAPSFRWYHNTFWRSATNSGQAISHAAGGAGYGTNGTLYNNIFAECGDNFGVSVNNGWYSGDDGTNGLKADYNLVVGRGAGTTKAGGWQAVGTDSHSINGSDPLFVSPSTFDFRLQAGSPALNAGTNLLFLVSTDILGASRDATPSMGAYEESADAPPSTTITFRTGTGRGMKAIR